MKLDVCDFSHNESAALTFNPWTLVLVLHGCTETHSLDAKRVTALRANGWLALFRLRSTGNEGLETWFGAPFESAATAFLHVVCSVIIARILITARAVVKIK